ncbi:hypothetical protein [Streptomyces triculaminicus]|uniref:hypothetical protein n=1 Tax=Streptomyces triculaminicus TaxID=2816232 RepID=UPI0037D4923B
MSFDVCAEAVHTVSSMAQEMGSGFLGAGVDAWRVGLVVAIALAVAATLFRRIRIKTRHEAGRLPILILFAGRLLIPKAYWQKIYERDWLPDQIAMMQSEETTWKGRALRYMECCTYAFSATLKGARDSKRALTEKNPRRGLFRPYRTERLRNALILFLTTGIGCGITTMMQDPLTQGRLAIGGSLGLGVGLVLLLLKGSRSDEGKRRSRGRD